MRRSIVLAAFLLACGDPVPAGTCSATADCRAGEQCVDGACVARVDAGPADAGPIDAGCTCGPGEVCSATGCSADCGSPASTPCGAGQVCDFATGACAAEGTAGIL